VAIACLTILAVVVRPGATLCRRCLSHQRHRHRRRALSSAIVAAFVAVYARRLSRLRAESARNEKLAVLGRLVGSMSHELNTPLATILLLCDLKQFRADMPAEEVDHRSSIAAEQNANGIVGLVAGTSAPIKRSSRWALRFRRRAWNAELDRLG
jgi:two-component system sensor histidine kinase RegB